MTTRYHQSVLATISIFLAVGMLFYFNPQQKSNNLSKEDNLKCISRSTMIARGQQWVNAHVPYNHQGTYEGYRTDCSGFVSMCWELAKPGMFTYTIQSVIHNITKTELQNGDALLCDSHHIVLFAGWSDTSKTHYVAMQQVDPQHGTVKRVNPYPYYSNTTCFHPIRFNSVC